MTRPSMTIDSTFPNKRGLTRGLLASLGLITLLAGCMETTRPPQNPLYQRLNSSANAINPQAALNLINNYRQSNNLPMLQLDPRLTAAAQEQANGMAEAGQVRHSLKKTQTLPKRLARANFAYSHAAENISAGYWTLAEAFSGWRDSKRHNRNMLNKHVTHMGIATRYNANVKYKVYWALVLAAPEKTMPQPVARQKTRPDGSLVKLLGQP